MAFWNRKCDKKTDAVTKVARMIDLLVGLREDVHDLRLKVDKLRARVNEPQPVPTNGKPQTGGAVQDWLPIVDRMQELLLVQMGNADLAQAFGTYARQRELRESEEQPNTTWTEPDESSYENI